MIKITSYNGEKQEYQEQIIETVLDGMKWSGDKDQSGRMLEFKFLYNPRKPKIHKYQAKCGDKVTYSDFVINGNKSIERIYFQGYVERIEYDTDNDTITVNCRDCLSYLKRSRFIGRFKGTLKQIFDQICGIFNLQNDVNSSDTSVFNIVSDEKKTYYDVLFEICTKIYGEFYLYIENSTLKVEKLKDNKNFKITAELVLGKNIRKSVFSQDIAELITKQIIIDNNKNLITIVEDNELLDKYGLFQSIYDYNKDDKKKILDSKSLRNTLKRNAKIVADNDNNCMTGKYVKIIEPYNKMIDTFKIIKDEHIIGVDSYMILELELD